MAAPMPPVLTCTREASPHAGAAGAASRERRQTLTASERRQGLSLSWGLPSLAPAGSGRSCSQASSMASTRRLTGCSAPRALHERKAWLWAKRGHEGGPARAQPHLQATRASGAKGGGWAGSHMGPWLWGAPGVEESPRGETGQQGQECVWSVGQAGDGRPAALVQVPGSPHFQGLSSRLPAPQLETLCHPQWLLSTDRTRPADPCPLSSPAFGPPRVPLFPGLRASLPTGPAPILPLACLPRSQPWLPPPSRSLLGSSFQARPGSSGAITGVHRALQCPCACFADGETED